MNDYKKLHDAARQCIWLYLMSVGTRETAVDAMKMLILESLVLLAKEIDAPPSDVAKMMLISVLEVEKRYGV